MRRIVYGLDGDPTTPVIGNVPNHVDLGPVLYTLVGDGNPCFVWADPNLPYDVMVADEIGANFNTGMIVSSDYQTNRLAAAAMMASPPPAGVDDDGTNVVWKVA